ncbi:MAG: nicotinamidase [Pseudomonadota bacterium]|nr:nicotinamidase [Pseudomonadota bacterium]
MNLELKPGDALLVVDVQNDFCPGGHLEVAEGDQVVPVLNQWLAAAIKAGAMVIASRDWHPVGHVSFQAQGGPWPDHCVQDTWGAEFHPDLQLPDGVVIVSKGTRFDEDAYSAFHNTGLGSYLKRQRVKRLFIGGLAQDICVRDTVLSARKEGFEVVLLRAATRPVDAEKGAEALRQMAAAGAEILDDL